MEQVSREQVIALVNLLPEGSLVPVFEYLESVIQHCESPAERAWRTAPLVDPEPDELEALREFDEHGIGETIPYEVAKRLLASGTEEEWRQILGDDGDE